MAPAMARTTPGPPVAAADALKHGQGPVGAARERQDGGLVGHGCGPEPGAAQASQGVSGSRLAQEAWQQAWLFGATFVYMRQVEGLSREDGHYRLQLSDGAALAARTVVITTGATHRRLSVPTLETPAGSLYSAGVSEAPAMRGRNVFITGGGKFAGQAAMHLAKWADQVTVLVRGESLTVSMSDYLIREIDAAPNVGVTYRVEVVGGAGGDVFESLLLEDRESGTRRSVPADALFVLIGSQPQAEWLGHSVARDQCGFILTGPDLLGGGAGR